MNFRIPAVTGFVLASIVAIPSTCVRAQVAVENRTTVRRVVEDPPAASPRAVTVEKRVVAAEPEVAVKVPTVRRTFRVADIRPPDVGIWFDPTATDSLVIDAIAPIGPAAQLGFEEGDRILEVNGVKVTRETDFLKLLFATKARDQRVEVLIVRKNREQVVVVEPALLIDEYLVVRHDPLEQLGLVVDDRFDDRVVVWKVIPRSPAFYGGIRPGDVITRFGDQRVVQRSAFGELIRTVRPGIVRLEVDRARRTRPIQIEVPRDWTVDEQYPVGTDVRVETEVRKPVTVEADAPPPPPKVAPPKPPVPPREEDDRDK